MSVNPITRCPATNAAHEWRREGDGYFCCRCLELLETQHDADEWRRAANAIWFPQREMPMKRIEDQLYAERYGVRS